MQLAGAGLNLYINLNGADGRVQSFADNTTCLLLACLAKHLPGLTRWPAVTQYASKL